MIIRAILLSLLAALGIVALAHAGEPTHPLLIDAAAKACPPPKFYLPCQASTCRRPFTVGSVA